MLASRWGLLMRSGSQATFIRHFVYAIRLILLALVVGIFPSLTWGQGLLGQRYFSVGYEAALQSPNFFGVDWSHNYVSRSNHPFSETWDFGTNVRFEWASGQVPAGGGGVPVDFEFSGFDISLTKHFRPEARLDPFARLGVGYFSGEAEADFGGGAFLREEMDDTGLYWSAGVELELGEQSAVLTQIRSSGSLEDFDVEELAYKDLFFESILVRWWREKWLSGFSIGSDFDEIEIRLGGFVGYSW